jgi:hypothetical protein
VGGANAVRLVLLLIWFILTGARVVGLAEVYDLDADGNERLSQPEVIIYYCEALKFISNGIRLFSRLWTMQQLNRLVLIEP